MKKLLFAAALSLVSLNHALAVDVTHDVVQTALNKKVNNEETKFTVIKDTIVQTQIFDLGALAPEGLLDAALSAPAFTQPIHDAACEMIAAAQGVYLVRRVVVLPIGSNGRVYQAVTTQDTEC